MVEPAPVPVGLGSSTVVATGVDAAIEGFELLFVKVLLAKLLLLVVVVELLLNEAVELFTKVS